MRESSTAANPEPTDRHGRLLTVERSFVVDAPIERTFDFFADPRTLDSVTPEWFRLRVVSSLPSALTIGDSVDYRMRWRLVPLRWQSVITEWTRPHLITYRQARGPYRDFVHRHIFAPEDGVTLVTDRIQFRAPGPTLISTLVASELGRILDYRAVAGRRLLKCSLVDRRGDSA